MISRCVVVACKVAFSSCWGAGATEEPTAVHKFLFPVKEELPDDFEVR